MKDIKIIFCGTLMLMGYGTKAQIADVLKLANSLSSGINDMQVFVSMDESLKALENFQEINEELKDATEWADKMQFIGEMLVLVESSVCAMNEMNALYSDYLDLVWKWNQDGGCMIGLDYNLMVARAKLIEDIIVDLVDSDKLTEGERNVMSMDVEEEMDKLVDDVKDLSDELRNQINAFEDLNKAESTYVSPSSIELPGYDLFDKVEKELMGSTEAVFLYLGRILLLIGFIPAVMEIARGEGYKIALTWVSILLLFIAMTEIFF